MLTCITTVLIGFTSTLTDIDIKAIASAKKTCQRVYPDNPCLVKMVKNNDLDYSAICGKKRKIK